MDERDTLLALDDTALLAHCRVERTRASGPGGQHRNTRDTAVRLTLAAHPEISGGASERRSQHANRANALARLRLAIALGLRSPAPPAWPGPWQLNPANPDYPRFVAVVFDALDQHDYAVGEAAAALGLSTGQLVRLLERDAELWATANQARAARGLKPLRA